MEMSQLLVEGSALSDVASISNSALSRGYRTLHLFGDLHYQI
jgi:hypothetical protein